MDNDILASQKQQDMLAAFWPRRVSPYLTRVLVKTPITPNQTTVLWGVISLLNCYTVYLALQGSLLAIPAIALVYELCFVLDCVDGEIARFKNIVNPIGGKLLDGICHRTTEFALLATFVAAAYTRTDPWFSLIVGLFLLSGDAMYLYVYERRLTALRVQAGYTGQIRKTATGVYQRGTPWRGLTPKQQLQTITGLFHYKSVYAVIAASYLPAEAFLAGLAALGLYKHAKWLALTRQTLADVAGLQPVAARPAAVSNDTAGAARSTVH